MVNPGAEAQSASRAILTAKCLGQEGRKEQEECGGKSGRREEKGPRTGAPSGGNTLPLAAVKESRGNGGPFREEGHRHRRKRIPGNDKKVQLIRGPEKKTTTPGIRGEKEREPVT